MSISNKSKSNGKSKILGNTKGSKGSGLIKIGSGRQSVTLDLYASKGTPQKDHMEALISILNKYSVAFSLAKTGFGKTYVTVALAENMGFKQICVFGPKSSEKAWINISDNYRTPDITFITFGKLIGNKNRQPSTDFLYRELEDEEVKKAEMFSSTVDWKEYLSEGKTLIVVDESHNLKNKSDSSYAISELITYAKLNKCFAGRNKVLFLTADAIQDKDHHGFNFLRLIGIYDERDSYKNKFYFTAKLAIKMNKKDVVKIIRTKPDTIKEYKNALQKLWHIITDNIVEKGDSVVKSYEFNYFVNVDKSKIACLEDAIEYMENSRDEYGNAKIERYGKGLQLFEANLVDSIVRLSKKILSEKEDSKIVLYFNNINSITKAAKSLIKYKPITITGTESSYYKSKKTVVDISRNSAINTYNEDNNKSRVIILSIKAGSSSISLHDTHGNRPRYMFIIPSNNFFDILQACGRIARYGQKSVGICSVVFPKMKTLPMNLIEKISNKGEVASNTSGKDGRILIYPGDFPRYVEDFGYIKEEECDLDSEELLEKIIDGDTTDIPIVQEDFFLSTDVESGEVNNNDNNDNIPIESKNGGDKTNKQYFEDVVDKNPEYSDNDSGDLDLKDID